MQYIKGTDRTQAVLFPQNLDDIIDEGNEVRIIDLFVESIDLAQFSFQVKSSSEGRPPYHPKDLLKLYVYGYLNSVRSSRALGRECSSWCPITTPSPTLEGIMKKQYAKYSDIPFP
jgi:transposase